MNKKRKRTKKPIGPTEVVNVRTGIIRTINPIEEANVSGSAILPIKNNKNSRRNFPRQIENHC